MTQPQTTTAATYVPSTAVLSLIRTYRDLRSDDWQTVALAALKVALIRVVEAESELTHDEVAAWVKASIPL